MDASKLTDYQLYEIIEHSHLDTGIRDIANDEFKVRELSIEQIKKLELYHDSKFKPLPDQPLEVKYKLLLVLLPPLLILIPFFICMPVQAIIANKYLIRGQKRKWKDYWYYVSLSYLVWTIGIILFSRFFLFTSRTD